MDDWRQKIQRSLRDSQVFLAGALRGVKLCFWGASRCQALFLVFARRSMGSGFGVSGRKQENKSVTAKPHEWHVDICKSF
jgi:hypothetical protein